MAVRTMSADMEMNALLAKGKRFVYPTSCIKSSRDHHIASQHRYVKTICEVSGRIYRTRHQAACLGSRHLALNHSAIIRTISSTCTYILILAAPKAKESYAFCTGKRPLAWPPKELRDPAGLT